MKLPSHFLINSENEVHDVYEVREVHEEIDHELLFKITTIIYICNYIYCNTSLKEGKVIMTEYFSHRII
jgi:hypothetical protein